MGTSIIDIAFDVRTDSGGRDPDSGSRRLKEFHKVLWCKKLPGGQTLSLSDALPNAYLYHSSELGEFFLSSDAIIQTYSSWLDMKPILDQVPKEEMEAFRNLAHTVGGFIIFPQNMVNGHHTLNQARGIHGAIGDRMDLTLECIRRYYAKESSPLKDTLQRYSGFFDLFSDFRGYCEFFLLQDLATEDFKGIKFFLPFADFSGGPFPRTVDQYRAFMLSSMDFVTKRNNRIQDFRIDP